MKTDTKKAAVPREPWFAARRELSAKRAAVLTVFSFSLPLLIWCAVSYLPFLWHPDVELKISADREGVTTVYTPGDRVSEEFFPQFEEAVREQNRQVEPLMSLLKPVEAGSEASIRRANKKVLRHLASLLVENGWLTEEQTKDDAAIFAAWKEIATGARLPERPRLSH